MKNRVLMFLFLVVNSSFCIKLNKVRKIYFDVSNSALVFDYPIDTLTKIEVYNSVKKGQPLNYSFEVKAKTGVTSYAIPKPTIEQQEKTEFTIWLYTTERSSAVYYIDINPGDWKRTKKLNARQDRR